MINFYSFFFCGNSYELFVSVFVVCGCVNKEDDDDIICINKKYPRYFISENRISKCMTEHERTINNVVKL